MTDQPLEYKQCEDLVRALGLIFSNTFLYGDKHSVTTKALNDCFTMLDSVLSSVSEVSFSIAEDELKVNNVYVEQKNPLIGMFITYLEDREIRSFGITSGIDLDKFKVLIEVLNAKPEELKQLGGFAGAINTLGIENVTCRQVSYVEVTEDEVVVSKEDAEKSGGGDVDAAILAFLKGDVGASDEAVQEAMSHVATDADKLSDLIMHTVEVREKEVDLENAESFDDLVVGCLKKTYDAMLEDPASKTQKGKKAVGKTLMLLQEELLEKMRERGGMDAEEISKLSSALSETVEEMQDELTIDTLATSYMKKRNAIETNESKILRFIKSKGLDRIDESDLRDKLMEGGLTPDGWNELLVRSGIRENKMDDGQALAAMGHLAMLLERMEGAAQGGEGGAGEGAGAGEGPGEGKGGGVAAAAAAEGNLDGVISEVTKEVNGLVEHAGKKIHDFVESVKGDILAVDEIEAAAAKQGKAPKMSRRKLMEVLAEIVQELCQPLAVINCSIDMIKAGSLGDVSDSQADMLNLASESSSKLQVLIDNLQEIAGLPDTLSPDSGIQSSLYEE